MIERQLIMGKYTAPSCPKKLHTLVSDVTMGECQKEFPKLRLWRREPGLYIQYHSKQKMYLGQPGEADLYGFVPVSGVAIYLEIEIKTGKSTLKKKQRERKKMVEACGGIFIEGREDIKQTIEKLKKECDRISAKLRNQNTCLRSDCL